jgi:hypothetical protein
MQFAKQNGEKPISKSNASAQEAACVNLERKMAKFVDECFEWNGKRVSEMSKDELRQALCRAISDLEPHGDSVAKFRAQHPILDGFSEPLSSPRQFHGPQGEACEWAELTNVYRVN